MMERPQKILLVIVLLNVVSTWLHYTDNALFIEQYTGLAWFTPIGILVAVTVMTPIGLFGYWLYTQGRFSAAYGLLGVYSIAGLSSPGHYLLPGAEAMALSVKMQSFIWLDGISGLLLLGFVVWSSLTRKDIAQQ